MRLLPLVTAGLLASVADAREKPTLVYQPESDAEDSRPVATQIVAGPQGSNYALRMEFDKLPWGEECKNRCANSTIFLDTDNNKETGLQMADKAAGETGADLAITVLGAREPREGSADLRLKVRVRQLPDTASTLEEGETLAELDHRRDPERVVVDGKTVSVLVDATGGTLPSGPKLRVVYHPPGSKALVANAKGLLGGGSSKVQIFKQGKKAK